MTSEIQLWQRYHEQGSREARSLLIERYLGLVHHVAREVEKRLRPAMELDDLVSAGTFGLVRAVDSYDPSRGVAFSTYATPRIHGAIMDELRALDWRPRSVRERQRQLDRVSRSVEAETGGAATAQEVASRMGVDLTTYFRWRSNSSGGAPLSLDDPSPEARSTVAQIEAASGREVASIEDVMAREEMVARLRAAIEELPERSRMVLVLYYYRELNQRQIAEILHVTESRVSQIRTDALRRLRIALQAYHEETR
ncbi:MAG TPA: FliA/WhiG family RNA polymerase sigma factor [Gemmatimonadaceae bacterium]|nr:FliA/WhiG family RNA polymerase sigma factor [Gemmatimonadaceae bacterium]